MGAWARHPALLNAPHMLLPFSLLQATPSGSLNCSLPGRFGGYPTALCCFRHAGGPRSGLTWWAAHGCLEAFFGCGMGWPSTSVLPCPSWGLPPRPGLPSCCPGCTVPGSAETTVFPPHTPQAPQLLALLLGTEILRYFKFWTWSSTLHPSLHKHVWICTLFSLILRAARAHSLTTTA